MRIMLLWLLSVTAQAADTVADPLGVTPVWAEQYLQQQHSYLLADSENDHVLSMYYFGRIGARTLLGMERVRGENYEQFYTLLVFEQRQLLGYFPQVMTFPSALQGDGEVVFPLGVAAHGEFSNGAWNISADPNTFEPLCQGLGERMQCVPWQPARPASAPVVAPADLPEQAVTTD
ncbi:hypothetical protein GJQ55_07060 [Venatoribacter cucullus]|uniref:Uncharacterized protein n=1 Tax=Venatoribacter cucullus TaxID=2661630 RepID=A0A9X7UY60_9GAMM|nr:hypothetical protein [Venatoribacter cucullus]QQD21573.1 hypothetical protein GJQ54_07230 [Oceanospirillaceae bacterium ASx5O]QQD24250.1 hypothetical protein GJQ55_07060 [Venatoribacter cucullus]